MWRYTQSSILILALGLGVGNLKLILCIIVQLFVLNIIYLTNNIKNFMIELVLLISSSRVAPTKATSTCLSRGLPDPLMYLLDILGLSHGALFWMIRGTQILGCICSSGITLSACGRGSLVDYVCHIHGVHVPLMGYACASSGQCNMGWPWECLYNLM